jgi:hypothetical protein
MSVFGDAIAILAARPITSLVLFAGLLVCVYLCATRH